MKITELLGTMGLLASACCIPKTGPSLQAQSQSVYKVIADVEVGLGDETGATLHVGWSGTAWTVAREHGHSFLMTAGHVCETSDEMEGLPILSVSYTLVARDGTRISGATPVLDDDDADLCTLAVVGDLGEPMSLATVDPEYGAVCTDIGAPRGYFGEGIAPIAELRYSGRGTIFGDHEGLGFVGLIDHGSSGSPVVCDGRVVGLLNLGSNDYVRLGLAVPYEAIREHLIRALHRALHR